MPLISLHTAYDPSTSLIYQAKIKIMLVCCLPTDPRFSVRHKYFFDFPPPPKKNFPTRAGKVRILVRRFLFPGIISLCLIFNRVQDPNQLTTLNSLFQPMSVSLTMTCVAIWLRGENRLSRSNFLRACHC